MVQVGKDAAVQTLILQPGSALPVRVVRRDGEPVAEASFVVASVHSQPPEAAAPRWVHEFALQFASWSLARTRTDAAGRATLRFLSVPDVELEFRGELGKSGSDLVPLWAGDEVMELRLR